MRTAPPTLLAHADAAMYEAKSEGGGVTVYGADTADPLERLALAARLRRAIERGELELHYQPVCRARDGGVLGIEALVRWRDPERGLIPPVEFIPVAERAGVIDALGAWVLEAMCVQGAEWRDRGLHPNIGVNVSPRQLRRPGFAAWAADMVRRHEIDLSRFVFELTESAWSLEASRMLPVLREMRAQGLTLAIDDFGAGYSSLWRLRELPVQVIKVDRAFLVDVPSDPQACAVYVGDHAAGRHRRLRRRLRGRGDGRSRSPSCTRSAARSSRATTSPARSRRRGHGAPRGAARARAAFLTLPFCGRWPSPSRSSRTRARRSAARSTRSPRPR